MDIKLQTIDLDGSKLKSSVVNDILTLLPYAKMMDGAFTKTEPGNTLYFIGSGKSNLLCGKCSSRLAENVERDSLNDQLYLKCSKCETWNQVTLASRAKVIPS